MIGFYFCPNKCTYLIFVIMSVILHTGFEKVFHRINFQPETPGKGQDLVNAGHVINVEEHRESGVGIFIKADIIRQTSVTKKDYLVKLHIDAARQITSVSCNCVYGNSSKCKHVAALIEYVNNDKSESKTNYEQLWGKPSAKKQKLKKYAKGILFSEMYPPQGDLEIEQSEVQLSELKNRSALKIMIFESTKDEVEESVKDLMNSILIKIDLGRKKEDCKVCVETFLAKCTTKNVYSKEPVILGELKDFYDKAIKLSRNQIVKLACDTLEQSDCDEWFNSRYLRVSASKKAYCIKSRIKKTVESLIGDMLFPKKLDIRATRYGREHESKAREMYKSLFNVNVMNVGVVVSEKQPWLCASLDGVVIEDSKITKIVEIKCPSSCDKKSIVDFSTKTCNLPYLKFNGNKAELRESTVYYTQCQVQMYISGLDLCDLFIYTPIENGSICIPVKRNEIFLSNTVIKCEEFYFTNFLPALLKKVQMDNVKQAKSTRCFTVRNIINEM